MRAPKLITVITAVIMMAGRISGAEYSLTQLQEIERYIMANDRAALWALLRNNPNLMVGNDPLAQELRTFMETSMRNQLTWFDAPTATLPPDPALSLGKKVGSIY
jgi:hypothetical protein